MRILLLTAILMANVMTMSAAKQKISIDRIDPTDWYVGMKNPSLQLMVYGKNIASVQEVTTDYPGAVIDSVVRLDSPNYLLVYMNLREAQAGTMTLQFKVQTSKFNVQSSLTKVKATSSITKFKVNYTLKQREMAGSKRMGFTNADVLYMLMPDRFAQGAGHNPQVKGMRAYKEDRSQPSLRHGGDLNGIREHLDYFNELGVTALWLTPVLENDSPDDEHGYSTYHGYATTDYYRVDPRFGTNEDYRRLCDEAHQKGLKVVMDMIFNHSGFEHPWTHDMPAKDWLNLPQWLVESNGTSQAEGTSFLQTSYKLTPVVDPYASKVDMKETTEGWFVPTMPDLNQHNPHLMRYLIQNSIWWIETVGIDGIRMDTYPYNDKYAMQKWCDRMHKEFPGFSLLGECWLNDNPFITYYSNGVKNLDGYTSGLDHVTDFPLTFAMNRGFQEADGWDTGLLRVYQNFVSDYLLPHPEKNVIFIDNHDVNRIMTDMKGDVDKLKLIYTIVLTQRGIPCMYYGSEMLYESEKPGDGYKRKNMYGGWQGDTKNAFTGENLTDKEKDFYAFIKTLANFRKSSNAFSGKMIHFVPQDGVYVYFRINGNDKVMVVINNSDYEKNIDLSRFEECLRGVKSMSNVLDGMRSTSLPSTIKVDKKSSQVWVLK